MLNTDEYMKTIIGDTYTRSEINIKEPTLQTVDLYPESYLKINPIVINKCKKITQKPTKTIINQITDEIFKELNEKEGVSILMVTHDSKIASYSSKLLYIKDGIIDRTIEREGLSQKEYFYKIVDINSSESQELFE